jgi:ubiquinone biosynthesis protein
MSLAGDLRRMVRIGAVVSRHLAAYALTSRRPHLARRLGVAQLSGPDRLRSTFEDLGGTFLKLGQMLALQPDILSLEYCNALFNLMDRVPPFGVEQVERILREELGGGPGELFEHFERSPLAAASVGQVHRAVVDGRRVAVKVQRPSVEEDFRGDIRLMRAFIGLIGFLRWRLLTWMIEPLSEFVAWTREELDYRFEARYAERLRANAKDTEHERVPEVFPRHSTRRILTAELLDGVTVLDYLRALAANNEVTLRRVAAGGFVPEVFARHIIQNFLGDAFRHGMFHADLHPANLMILSGNVVGYIDFGITAVLSSYSRRHLVELTLAYTRGDMDGMCAAFFKVSSIGPRSRPQQFAAGLHRLAEDWYTVEGNRRRLRKNFTLVMLDMLNLSRATGILPERDVVKYIRSAIAIDGLITRFAPGFDVGGYLESVCDRYLRMQGLQAAMSRDRMLSWGLAGAHLVRDGAFRTDRFLDRVLAAVAGLVALAGLGGGGEVPGMNVATAQALIAAAGLVVLVGGAWRRT